MRKQFRLITASSIVLSLLGCEGYRTAKGIVKDKASSRPLAHVRCKVLAGSEVQYTDSLGAFKLHGEFGGCLPDCPDVTVEFSKEGYKSLFVKNPSDSLFYLAQSKTNFIK